MTTDHFLGILLVHRIRVQVQQLSDGLALLCIRAEVLVLHQFVLNFLNIQAKHSCVRVDLRKLEEMTEILKDLPDAIIGTFGNGGGLSTNAAVREVTR